MVDFEEYIRQGEPSRAERAQAWRTAIGLQDVAYTKTVRVSRMLSTMMEENVSPTEIEASIGADGGRWVDLVIKNTGHGVSIVATYDGREIGVKEEFATLFPNGDFNGSYSFTIPAERYFPSVKVRLSITIHNGSMCVMSY